MGKSHCMHTFHTFHARRREGPGALVGLRGFSNVRWPSPALVGGAAHSDPTGVTARAVGWWGPGGGAGSASPRATTGSPFSCSPSSDRDPRGGGGRAMDDAGNEGMGR